MRGIDGSTIRGIVRANGHAVPWSRSFNLHPFQYVGFRGAPLITPYARLVKRWGRREHRDPWGILARYYPPELVERVRVVLVDNVRNVA
jgi:hypothetical protein